MPGAQRPAYSESAGVEPPIPGRFDPAFYDPAAAPDQSDRRRQRRDRRWAGSLDLDYFDDSRASVDMNIAYTAAGKFVEVQGSAEKAGGFDRDEMTP